MKRRNAETGKMRRPIKRTKITEGMYGNSMLYLKFVMLWATVVVADYMLEFRFEFLWPFWMMLRSVYDSFKYQGLAFSVFFICIALTSDMICFFFIPIQWIFFAASTYVWVQYVWYTVADKGACLPTVALCCAIVYVEGAVRVADRGGGIAGGGLELYRPLAAHCVGYPAVTLGFGFKSYVSYRLRLRRQRRVQQENEFYYQLMRQALPESALETNQTPPTTVTTKESERSPPVSNGSVEKSETEHKHMNGTAIHNTTAKIKKSERERERRTEPNGMCHHDHSAIQINSKVEKQTLQNHVCKEREWRATAGSSPQPAPALSNGEPPTHQDEEDRRHDGKSTSKSTLKCEKKDKEKELITQKEEKKRNKNKEKDKDKETSDSHKSTEQVKEQIVKEKEVENTKEVVKCSKESNLSKEKEKDRERERELREARECAEELKRVRAELAAAKAGEAEARRALAAAVAADRQRRADHQQLRHAHAALQHKLSTWRGTERAALERRLGEERRARTSAEQQLQRAQQLNRQRKTSECDSEWCRTRRAAAESEAGGLRRELQRAHDAAANLQRDLSAATDQVRALELRQEESGTGARLASALQALQERAAHLERSLSAETRVKLDLFSALGEAKRQLQIREGLISKQEKEIEELKAQMLAVLPPDSFVSPAVAGGAVSKLRLTDGSPLDPNASVYTPKQLCSDA
ncbi:Macoilin [Eumeta japonica]|uniref:Macoilin n=1 Tax=Eumeta variegata TaxID=151549 RepID=A0A4C1WZX5_EUMVA|nr:Macoilin [Eumeta japonica]